MVILGETLDEGFDSWNRRKVPAKYLLLKCDGCGCEFERRRTLKDLKRSYHYHSTQCRCDAMRLGGIQNVVLRSTNLRKYGVEYPSQDREIRQKAIDTWMKKHGVDNPAKSAVAKESSRLTSLERYGVEHAIVSMQVKEKIRHTCRIRYGTVSPHSFLYRTGQHESHKSGNVYYRSSYELRAFKLLDLDDNVITYVTEPISIDYEFNCKKCMYFPDILVIMHDGLKFLEIKPQNFVALPVNMAKQNALAVFCEQNNIKFEIWTEYELGLKEKK